MPTLLLGPVLRYVDATTATVWVETDGPCTVEVLGCQARTFPAGGHHYAIVPVEGLQPASSTEYQVRLDGRVAWPEPGSAFPPSRIRTPAEGSPHLRVLFGSCRFAGAQRPDERNPIGPDALDTYATRMARQDPEQWPHRLLLLGDQVYADETTPEMRQWLATRRDLRVPPGAEVADFEEYTRLYRESWSVSQLRWLLSTVPTAMIFDDHDVRDDWNTSQAWREEMAAQPWWAERIRGGLASYWIYQHIGNLSPKDLAEDPIYTAVREADGDALPVLRELADAADREIAGSKGMRWSYRQDIGSMRLLVVDSRCGRILGGGERKMVSDDEFDWVEHNAEGDYDHLLIASSLPWLLPHGISEAQSWNEAAVRRGGWRGRLAERVRRAADMDHWASFRESFDRLARLLRRVADGEAGGRPASVCVLSGDVHHSYVAEARYPTPTGARVLQLTCSPVCNIAPATLRALLRAGWSTRLARVIRWFAVRRGVRPPEPSWNRVSGPHFGNAVAILEVSGRRASLVLERAESTRDGPRLAPLADLPLTA